MIDKIFVIGDGDGIRKRIESYLLSGDLESLGAFSSSLTEAIQEIEYLAASTMNSQIVFAGGDDILFIVTASHYKEEQIRELMNIFSNKTQSTISFGVGPNIETAFINLT
ncbi:MAG: hypothetical protein WBV94_00055 [Blastocatellia bacterium]